MNERRSCKPRSRLLLARWQLPSDGIDQLVQQLLQAIQGFILNGHALVHLSTTSGKPLELSQGRLTVRVREVQRLDRDGE